MRFFVPSLAAASPFVPIIPDFCKFPAWYGLCLSRPHKTRIYFFRVHQIPLSIVTVREKVDGNRWLDERWRVLGAVAGEARNSGKIVRTLLRAGADSEQYLWNGLMLRLHPSEADAYYYNLIGQNPSLYVYCHQDESGEPCPRSVTAEYIDAMAHSETGNPTFAVPMPPDVYRAIEAFVLEHFVPEEPKMKRKRERETKRSGIWDDE